MIRRKPRGIVAALGVLAAAVAIFTPASASASSGGVGAVYTLTNATAGNAVLAYTRFADGSLAPAGSFPTGGTGTGGELGSQNAVIVSSNHQWLFAVNAGSNSISSFRIRKSGLQLADTASSGGTMPISVAYQHGLLYVLNAGVPNNVTGFTVGNDGNLTQIPNSTRPLSAPSTNPAQVGFSRDGNTLVVTEKDTNLIDTWIVRSDGTLTGRVLNPSAGPTPFGFAPAKRDTLFVSNAGTPSGAAFYHINPNSSLTTVSPNVPTGQNAGCWAVVTKNGRYGFVTNTGSGTISSFTIGQDGTLTLLNPVAATTGGAPADTALSHNSHFLYTLVAATGGNFIAGFRVGSDGSLTRIETTPTNGLVGLAAY